MLELPPGPPALHIHEPVDWSPRQQLAQVIRAGRSDDWVQQFAFEDSSRYPSVTCEMRNGQQK
jgi:hypothetical protein